MPTAKPAPRTYCVVSTVTLTIATEVVATSDVEAGDLTADRALLPALTALVGHGDTATHWVVDAIGVIELPHEAFPLTKKKARKAAGGAA